MKAAIDRSNPVFTNTKIVKPTTITVLMTANIRVKPLNTLAFANKNSNAYKIIPMKNS